MNGAGQRVARASLAYAKNAAARASAAAENRIVVAENAASLAAATVNAEEISHPRILIGEKLFTTDAQRHRNTEQTFMGAGEFLYLIQIPCDPVSLWWF